MDVSAIPYEMKQRMLDQIRQQVGDDTYRQLVGRFGEDGLLAQVLEQVKANEAKPRRPRWKTICGWGLVIAIVGVLGIIEPRILYGLGWVVAAYGFVIGVKALIQFVVESTRVPPYR